jgi:hypothetical protein
MIKTLLLTFLIFCTSSFAQEHIQKDDIGPGLYSRIEILQLSGEKTLELTPGITRQFQVLSTVMGRAGSYRRVVAPTVWSVSPKIDGVSIDSKGELTVAANVSSASFTITAEVTIKEEWEPKGYVAKVDQPVIVFDPKEKPLVGLWYQVRTLPCKGAPVDNRAEKNGVRELQFRADGSFSVTVDPFEAYKDYWGSYKTAGPSIEFNVSGGNHVPVGSHFAGSFHLTSNDVLELRDVTLWPDPQIESVCGTTFARFNTEPQIAPVAWLHQRYEKCCVEEYVWHILDDYVGVLNVEVPSMGHIVIRPKTAAAGKFIERMIRKRFKIVRFDATRITITTEKPAGSQNSLETWLVPPGAEPPTRKGGL